MAFLRLLSARERIFSLAATPLTGNRIGRLPELEVPLEDVSGQLSRLHAVIRQTPEGWSLEDAESQNGTWLGEQRLVPGQPHLLADGDVLRLGTIRLQFHLEAPAEGALPVLASLDTTSLLAARPQPPGGSSDRRLELLYDLGKAVQTLDDQEALLETLLQTAIHALKPERAYLGLYDSELAAWRLELSLVEWGRRRADFPRSAQLVRRALEEGSATLIGDVQERGPEQFGSLTRLRVRSVLCVPLLAGALRVGILYLEDPQRPHAFCEADLQFLAFLGTFLGQTLANARRLDREVRARQALEPVVPPPPELTSPVMQELQRRVQVAAATSFPVLILGETGTGKSTLARQIHRLSPRRDGPFVALNCAAIPETLLESELFGYAPRSGISGADPKGKPGRFEQADGGTLFLDEIGDMPIGQQTRLLMAVEEKRIQRLSSGDPGSIPVDVRIVAATAARPEEMLQSGRLRQDLYFRLGQVQLLVPPLRTRRDELPSLARRMLQELGAELPWRVGGLSPAAQDLLRHYDWPGNLRELRNALTQAALECPAGSRIEPRHLPAAITTSEQVGHGIRLRLRGDPTALDEAERERREQLISVLLETGSQGRAARQLGLSRQWVIELCQRYGIEIVQVRRAERKALE